jgi:hypothetical protein
MFSQFNFNCFYVLKSVCGEKKRMMLRQGARISCFFQFNRDNQRIKGANLGNLMCQNVWINNGGFHRVFA